MIGCAIAVWLTGALLTQQTPALVKQSELPPPNAAKTSQAPESAPKVTSKPVETATQPKESRRKPSKEEVQKPQQKPEPKTEAAPPPEAQKPAAGKRVAAFWFILPGR